VTTVFQIDAGIILAASKEFGVDWGDEEEVIAAADCRLMSGVWEWPDCSTSRANDSQDPTDRR
jgi:hypothetical protein